MRKSYFLLGSVFLGLISISANWTADAKADEVQSTQIQLTEGWNLIALPLQPVNPAIAEVLQSIVGQYETVWTYEDDQWFKYTASPRPYGSLRSMTAGRGYWIKMLQNTTLVLIGTPPVNAVNSQDGSDLRPGWNLLGYSSMYPSDVEDALVPLAGKFTSILSFDEGQWLEYKPTRPQTAGFDRLQPNHGYWIFVTESANWLARNFRGRVTDSQTGDPIPGCTVSLDAIDAEEITDTDGAFVVLGIAEAQEQLLTVIAPGYMPFSTTIDTAQPDKALSGSKLALIPTREMLHRLTESSSEDCVVKIDPLPTPAVMNIIKPHEGDQYTAPEGATSVSIPVQGYASLQSLASFQFDVVLVIDSSGSTKLTTGTDLDQDSVEDTVLDVELYACRQLVRSLLSQNIRFGVVKYGRHYAINAPDGSQSSGPILTSQTRVVQPLTSDRAAVEAALSTIASEGSVGGTHTAAGIDLAINALQQAPAVSSDTLKSAQPQRHVILLTDGVPTLPVEPGETQERKDRLETLTAAKRAKQANVFVHPVIVDPIRARDRKLTTMPSVAAVTGVAGSLLRASLNNINNLPRMLQSISFAGISAVVVKDHKTGQIWNLQPLADGSFQAALPALLGANRWTFEFATGGKNVSQKTVSFVVAPPKAAGKP